MQDVLNVVGGMGVMLPLLEQVCEAEQVDSRWVQETSDLLGPELTLVQGPRRHAASPQQVLRSVIQLFNPLLNVTAVAQRDVIYILYTV